MPTSIHIFKAGVCGALTKLELRKGALSMVVTWPLSATADLARWTAAVLQ